jgi:hypothetical protein
MDYCAPTTRCTTLVPIPSFLPILRIPSPLARKNAVALGSQLSYARFHNRLRFSDLCAFSDSEYQKTPIKVFVSAWGENTKTPNKVYPVLMKENQ